jgi:hypothetical protein
MVATGFIDNFDALLNSAADGISPLTGSQLIAAKVTRVVIMGGVYTSGTEFNFQNGPPSAVADFAANCPVPIWGVDFNMGNSPSAGLVSNTGHATDPFQDASFHSGTLTRPTWDAQAVMAGVLGLSTWFNVEGANGTNTVNASTGSNSWSSSPTDGYSYLGKTASDATIQTYINALVAQTSP